MMSWLQDSDRSSPIGTVEEFNLGYFDPDYLVEHEFDDEEEKAPVRHGQNVEELDPIAVLMKEILMLKSRVKEEEKNSKSLYDSLIKHEYELAFQDQLIEETESKIVEEKCTMKPYRVSW